MTTWPELPLDIHAVARGSDPGTSWQAAHSQEPQRLRQSQQAVLAVLRRSAIGLTDEELRFEIDAEGYRISDSGLRTRRSELVRLGLAADSGLRRVTAAGRQTIVWRAT